MPRRPNPIRRIIQWVGRRISSSEEGQHRLTEQNLLEHQQSEHRLTEQNLLVHQQSEQRILEQRIQEQRILEQRIQQLRQQRQAGALERRRRVRILYTNRWTESQEDLAQLATEGRHETHRPGEPIIYRVQLLERPEAVENIRRGLTLVISENGLTFRFDLLQMHDGEVTWVVQFIPHE